MIDLIQRPRQKREEISYDSRKNDGVAKGCEYPSTTSFYRQHGIRNELVHTIFRQKIKKIRKASTVKELRTIEAESMFDNHEELFESLRNQWGTTLATALSEYDREVRS